MCFMKKEARGPTRPGSFAYFFGRNHFENSTLWSHLMSLPKHYCDGLQVTWSRLNRTACEVSVNSMCWITRYIYLSILKLSTILRWLLKFFQFCLFIPLFTTIWRQILYFLLYKRYLIQQINWWPVIDNAIQPGCKLAVATRQMQLKYY